MIQLKKVTMVIMVRIVFFLLTILIVCCNEKIDINRLPREEVLFTEFDDNFKLYIKEVYRRKFQMLYEYNDSSYKKRIYCFECTSDFNYEFDIKGGFIRGEESFEWKNKLYSREINSKPIFEDPYFINKDYFYTLKDNSYSLESIDSIDSYFFYKIYLGDYR